MCRTPATAALDGSVAAAQVTVPGTGPACAGTTSTHVSADSATTEQPRVRGDDAWGRAVRRRGQEEQPRVRGDDQARM